LKYLLDQRLSTIPQHTWVSKLFGYDFTVEFKPGKQNAAADALSRCDEDKDDIAVRALSMPELELFADLRRELSTIQDAVAKRQEIERGEAGSAWSLVDGFIIHSGHIFIPESSSLWPQILATAHGAGHEGVQKTLHRLRASFYNPHINKLVRDFVLSCSTCQRNKSEHLHPAGLLQPLPVPSAIWQDAMDFVEGFPKVGGKSVVLTVVDRLSKYAHFIALGHPYSATSVARAFFDQVVRLHGIPCSIVSDRDPVFTSAFWTELFQLAGVKLHLSSAFHPQMDGQSEVTNRILGVYLRCLASDRPRSWLRWLPWTEFCYNSSYQTALRATLFEVVYGRPPPTMASYQAGVARVTALDKQLVERDTFLAQIRERLLHAQDYMKQHYDTAHRDVIFAPDDWAWLRLHHRTAAGITDTSAAKLRPRFYGPYLVLERVGPVAYRLQLPPRAKIHNVFHVVFLKKYTGDPPASMVPLPPIVHGRVVPTPAAVKMACVVRGHWEICVSWVGRAPADTTWEHLEDFRATYPDFQLEDKLFSKEGGNVVDAFTGVQYQRRRKKQQVVGSGFSG